MLQVYEPTALSDIDWHHTIIQNVSEYVSLVIPTHL